MTPTQDAIAALAELGDSSSLDDVHRNRLETIIRTALLRTAKPPAVDADRALFLFEAGKCPTEPDDAYIRYEFTQDDANTLRRVLEEAGGG